ncbi:MAG TPA: tRNA (adenosine(37)-N6)-threonylcarbamoyltransferase complex dimerization subunit type 1 TsaB [Gammaproteobacteria bacterium]|nr:tRNA (adenosine(37)-N6)-threonylcarbamoyltransferase complex dimerization subunit type 1 TsaB [Gammaproteobacteria bacterium]
MKILALDTSTEACSAALSINGEISERFELAPRGHSQLILPMLNDLLREAGLALAQIDAVAFGCGPGSFTGLRIAAGVTQGIAFGADLPVIPISSLAALAQGAHRETGVANILAAIDARMGEVYWAAYQCTNGLMQLIGDEGVFAPDKVPVPESGMWHGIGSGWGAYGDALQHRLSDILGTCHADRYPRARDVALLAADKFSRGQTIGAEQALPVYLRNEVAWKKCKTA